MQGKVALITGGSKHVGATNYHRLHAAGANLMLHYRASAGEARLLQAELNHQRRDSVALIQADLLDQTSLTDAVTDCKPAGAKVRIGKPWPNSS